MGKRAVFLVGAILILGHAEAQERFSLSYPGWTLYLDLRSPGLSPDPLGPGETAVSRSLGIRLPGRSLLSDSGLRLPLGDSTFLSVEATLVEWQASPALPATARRAFQAGVGVGVEF